MESYSFMKSDGIMVSDGKWTGRETEVGAERAGSVRTRQSVRNLLK